MSPKAFFAALALSLVGACAVAPKPAPSGWAIALHGGAGVIERASLSAETDAAYRAAIAAALETGAETLRRGGSSLDAVEATIRVLEDDPKFNAGRGAVFTAEGANELDASIMDGRTRAAGAVAGVTRTRHPISLARVVMERSPHVLLAGEGADRFSVAQGLEQVEPGYFFTERRWSGLEEALKKQNLPVPPRPHSAPEKTSEAAPLDERKFGTVGVVARDSAGNLAAGTSTGGTTAKRWGRVGDSPLVGAGTYAHNGVCAISATGAGEYFIRLSVARTICARMEMKGQSGQAAADAVIQGELGALGGDGGVVGMDKAGRAFFSFNTPGMYRGALAEGGTPVVAIFAGE